ncbi:hypothetical protein Pth03_72360 [Planotetraspora thailandica]|uniref:Uncharacterized protein n=1 Tax=Planotetraspora thailandica TaxID=487172 RepID=A0A8J4DFA3_9ACTN|nr:hypothetical protein [Planotetraspora thailandica]GII58847.1 hypothetical protein Pth03_72360 [Planotetraspora thailandica]
MTARVFWTELRRSPLRWWLPVLVALDVAMLLGRDTWWIGVWPEASAAAQLPAYFFGLVLGGGAAWVAGRTHRAGLTEQLSASTRARWQVELPVLAGTLAYGLVAFVPGVVIAAVVSAREAGPGFLWPSYLALGVCLVVLSAATGHLAGKLWSSRFVPAITVAVCLFGQTMLRPIRFYVLSGHPQAEVSGPALAVRVAFVLLMAAFALALPPRDARLGWSRARGVPLRPLAAVAAFAGLVAVAVAGPLLVGRPAPARALCSDETPRVCLWPENRKYLGPVSAMVARLNSLPGGALTLPPTFYERGLRAASAPDAGADFQFLAGDLSVPSFLSSAVIARTLPDCEVPSDAEERYSHEVFSLDAYLQLRGFGDAAALGNDGGPPGVDMREIARVASLPDDRQAEWVKGRLAAVREIGGDCRDR